MAITTITNSMVSVNAIQGTLIADNAITAVHIASNAVASIQIAENNVTAREIAANTITVAQLADDCVESDKIADGVITTNHLNKAMISSQTEVAVATGDFILLGDTSDSNNLKKAPISSILAGTLTTAAQTNITSLGTLTALTVDDITIDGSTISDASHLTIDAEGVIKLDANGGEIQFLDGGTEIGVVSMGSQNINIESKQADKDIVFKGIDGSSDVTALTLDMSDAGRALFNEGIRLSGLNGGTGLAFDMAGSGDYVIKESSTNDVMSFQGHLFHNFSSGNIGIGTASPSAILEVVDAGAAAPGTALKVHSNQNSAASDGLVFIHSEQALAPFTALNVRQDGNGDILNLLDGTTEVFTVINGGNVGIGTASPAAKLSVHGNVQFRTTNTDGNEERINWNVGGASDAPSQTMYGADGATAHVLLHAGGSSYFTGGNLGVGDNSPAYRLELPNTASSAGQVRANAYQTYSDSRIKTNIQTLSYGLDIVKQLKPSQYKHHNSIKEDGQFVKQDKGSNDIGFIAQEVLPLIPEVVSVPEDVDKDLYSINYPKLTAVLTKAIQEQQTIIEDLKARIETLEG